MERPLCPACKKGLLGYEEALVNGGIFDRVFCRLCGWSLDRPAAPVPPTAPIRPAIPSVPSAQPIAPIRMGTVTVINVGNTQKPVPAWVAQALALKTLLVPKTKETTMSDNTHHTLGDLNERLFSQLARISSGEITGEKLKAEIERTRAISGLAKEMISNAKLVLDAEVTLRDKPKPAMLAIEVGNK